MDRMQRDEIQDYARRAGFTVRDGEVDGFKRMVDSAFDVIDQFEEMVEEEADDLEGRSPGRRPERAEDPLNAVVRWCSVSSGESGILSGKRVGFKDVICVAGVPMTAGSPILQGFVPSRDAEVTKRVLAAGGEVVATLNMEDCAMSGGGETSFYGPVLNPHDLSRTASGSSGGSAAALFYEEIDITYGADQGGSIRFPAAWCGVLGLKPTGGLVPYTGIGELDKTYDHVGPLARTALELALGLQAVAGFHWADPRQRGDIPTADYVAAAEQAPDSLAGLRVGVVKEGFIDDATGHPEGTQATMTAAREALAGFAELGATVEEVSLPEHELGAAVFGAAYWEGAAATLVQGGDGYHWKGRYSPDLSIAIGEGLRDHADELSASVKWVLLMGAFLRERHFGSLYGRAQNAFWSVLQGFERALSQYDVLITPTVTHYAHQLAPDASFDETVIRGLGMIFNGSSADITGCPALSLPIAEHDGLPVGLQIIGKRFDDAKLISVASTWEKTHGWKPAAPKLERKSTI